MHKDITDILSSWPYTPGEVTARLIKGHDGKTKVQLRLDLGLLQMESAGRPDGKRPRGEVSLLDYHEKRLRSYIKDHGSESGFVLSSEECASLREEGLQYYFRYLAMFTLGEFESVEQDTARNLRLFDFVRNYATEPNDRVSLEVYRPYVVMMYSRAQALHAAGLGRADEGIGAINKGLKVIREFLKEIGQEQAFNHSCEVAILCQLKKELQKATLHQECSCDNILCLLKKDLDRAIALEEFEEAARLRDEIRCMEAEDVRGCDKTVTPEKDTPDTFRPPYGG